MTNNRGLLSEVLGAMSTATDLAAGNPSGSALTATVLAVRLGRGLGLHEEALKALYYACITRFIGCTATSEDTAAMTLGDELTPYFAFSLADLADPASVRKELEARAVPDAPQEARKALFDGLIAMGPEVLRLGSEHCAQAVSLTRRLPVPAAVPKILERLESRWDDLHPVHPAGPELLPETRIIEFAVVAELHRRVGGLRSMVEVARSRSGGQFDPWVVDGFLKDPVGLTAGFDRETEWNTYINAEPGKAFWIDGSDLRKVAKAFADFTDNKSRWFIGHSRQVAALVYRAACAHRSDEAWCDAAFNAGLLHDIGKCAIANGIWDKTTPLTPIEEMQARQHTAYTEYVLSLAPVLATTANIACSAHERADGSGYHRRSRLEKPRAALLAVANMFEELTSHTPLRAALPSGEAAEILLAEAHAGRLPRDAVRLVLAQTGQQSSAGARGYPDGMTPREAEVLKHLARGKTNKEIARDLDVSPKTIDNHLQNLFRKIGANTRSAAAMYAFEQGIFDP